MHKIFGRLKNTPFICKSARSRHIVRVTTDKLPTELLTLLVTFVFCGLYYLIIAFAVAFAVAFTVAFTVANPILSQNLIGPTLLQCYAVTVLH